MSSPATSTTPISAISAASSAPSRRASSARICAAGPTISTSTRSSRRSEEAWERGATEVCLQGGIHPEYTGATYLAVCRAIKAGVARHARARLLAARSLAGGEDAGPRLARFRRRAARCRSRLVARHRGGNPRRRGARGDLPGQGQDRRMARRSWRRRTALGCAARSRSCSAMSSATSTGRAICCACARCSSGPAASPNSCRCRSCRWRRRSR